MEFEENYKLVKISEIEELEKKLNIKLPKSFVEFYLKNNGGFLPLTPYFYEKIDGFEININQFIPIKYGEDEMEVGELYSFYRERYSIMDKFLPFADDFGGNLICLNIENSKIYMVFLDLDDVNFNNGAIRLLANDFETFLSGLSDESVED